MDPNFQALLRHVGQLIAGALLTKGVISESMVEVIIGLVVAIGMFAYSWITKKKTEEVRAATAAVALSLPSNSTVSTLNQALAQEPTPLPPVDPTTLPPVGSKP